MEVENISTSMACPRPPKRKESLMLSQAHSTRAGKTSVMENRLNVAVLQGENFEIVRHVNLF